MNNKIFKWGLLGFALLLTIAALVQKEDIIFHIWFGVFVILMAMLAEEYKQ